jgi:hypothetical protein
VQGRHADENFAPGLLFSLVFRASRAEDVLLVASLMSGLGAAFRRRISAGTSG